MNVHMICLTRCAVLLAVALLAPACATNPVTGGNDFVLMSEDQEIALGRQANAEILKKTPVYEDPELEVLVQQVGETLASHSHRPELFYRFTVLDSTAINAFALPGGYIYITRGLLAYLNSEAELAAVLGHEIGHVTARHSVRQQSTAAVTGILGAVVAASTGIQGVDTLTDMAGTAIVRGYGREHELEADRLGAEYLAKSGYDPNAMLEVVGVLKNQEAFETMMAEKEGREANVYHGLFSTHPDNDARFREVVNAAQLYRTGTTTRINRDSFLRTLNGLAFGDSEREGIIRGNHFYHKPLDFTITFPENWRIENNADRILAASPDNIALIQMSITDLNKRITPKQFMEQRMRLKNLRQGSSLESSTLEGYTAIADSNTSFGARAVRYVVLYRDKRAYIFACAVKNKNDSRRFDNDILATARSFRGLTAADEPYATEKKLAVIRAPAGTSYAGLAAD
ncbi:MAG TPA: M48 family metalloprotease, partial [Gammaproteobacteria bacterium]|nr:M48 family metalloprotease [Gammaproteobacteria bacterium]